MRQKWNLKIKGQMSNVISRISRWVTFWIWRSNFLCRWVFTRYFLSYFYPRQTKWYSNKIWRFLQIFVAFLDYQADYMNLFLYSKKATQIWWIDEISRLTKGQLILKCLFCVFNSPKKMKENNSTWGTIVVKLTFLFVFWENWDTEKTFRN